MRIFCRRWSGALWSAFALGALPFHCIAQTADPQAPSVAAVAAFADADAGIPDAPVPQSTQSSSSQSQQTGDSSQQPAPKDQQPATEEQRKKAQQQLEEQEHQRVMGVMATFNTTRNRDALPLSPGQKFQLFFKSETDPWPFGLALVVAGIGQADDSYPEWGQGMQGYAKRFGGAYTDSFIGNFFGNAVLTTWWHEDPRYYQKGTGSVTSRVLWAATSTVWCKRDKGTWGPNYANVIGNMIGSAIARAYYPPSDRTVSDTITDGLTVSAEGIIGSEVIEFWPDMVRSYRRKHAEKVAREAAKKDAQHAQPSGAPPAPANPDKPQN
jgi:hypothetical protein